MLPDPTTPQPGQVSIPDFRDVDQSYIGNIPEQALFENTNTQAESTDSPDSGHKEMSSDSLSYNLTQLETSSWYRITSPESSRQGTTISSLQSSERDTSVKSFDSQTKIITPVPHQDASGNPLELNLTPRIEPPPKVTRRSPKSPSAKSPSDFDSSASASKRNSVNSNCSSHSHRSGSTTSDPTAATTKHRENSLNLENKQMNNSSTKPPTELSVVSINDLSMSPANKKVNSKPDPKQQQQQQQQQDNSKLHISFSDDENTENSEDSGVPKQPLRLDSMTFDEFDALST